MRGGIERPDARRVRRLNLSQETMFPFLIAPGEISGQLKEEDGFAGAAEVGNVLIRKAIVVVSSRQQAWKRVPTLPKPGKSLNSII